ncbi:protein kinase [Chloroflexota bacterium]
MANLAGQTIKGYEIREVAGAGGFGAIYKAFQPVVKREVAIKVILPKFANQPDFIRNFEAEAQIVARLEHPHIVPLFDYWRDPDGAYLVMRWLDGGSLTDRIIDGPLEVETVAQILDQITAALSVAHRRGVVHRDLKPDNILLDEDGNAYLSDFGIAKSVGHETSDDNISGSLQYMAPEQLQGQPPTPEVDLYSLGLMTYHMLAGTHPWTGSTPSDMIAKHLTEPLPDICNLRFDLPLAIDDVIQNATAKQPDERFTDIREFARAFRQAIEPAGAPVSVEWEQDDTLLVNPYKGLRPFQEADADDFFGREALIRQLVNRMGEQGDYSRFLAVVGPSGSGKSSVVKAGLFPALWRDTLPGAGEWYYVTMVPGAHPIEQLEAALLSVAARPPSHLQEMLAANEGGLLWAVDRVLGSAEGDLLLLVDQFEELFALVESEEERVQFLDLLYTAVTAPDSRLRVVLTLRADFMDGPLEYVGFGELMRQRTEFVLPMSPDEIERAITGPASRVGVQVDTGLVAAIVADLREEPGILPLLQYTLTEVFERRENRTLTLEAYQSCGGVLGALAHRADEVYAGLDDKQQAIARQVFLRLMTLGEGVEDTRRRARIAELASLVADTVLMQTVLDAFGQYRLLTFDSERGSREPTVEVAHEALLREWGLLRGWLDDGRADVRLQRLLATAAAEWQEVGQDTSYLLSGTRLAQYEDWHETGSVALTEEEQQYIAASVAQQQQMAAEEQARQEHELELERRSRNRMRMLAGVLLVAAVVAGVLSVWAMGQSRIAQVERDRAEEARGTSEVNAEIAQARGTEVAGQVERVVAAQGTAVYEAERAATQEGIALGNAATAEVNALLAENNAATATYALGDAEFQAAAALAAQGTAAAHAEVALNNAATATIAQGDALFQAETAVAAQVTSDWNAERALNNAATATIAQGDAEWQAATAVAAQATSNWNAENALNSAATATIAQGDALFQAETAVAAQVTSDWNAGRALNNAATATYALGEAEIQAVTATIAQGDALFQAATAVAAQSTSNANAEAALNSAATATAALGQAEIQAQLALNNAATATIAQGDALFQAATAVAAQATSNANAQNALNNAATATLALGQAEIQAQLALDNAATATIAQGDALFQAETAVAAQGTSDANASIAQARGTEVAGQVETVVAAQGTAVYEADRASTQEAVAVGNAATAESNAQLALDNAATAEAALIFSEASERLARAQALASAGDQLLTIGNTDLALPLAIEAANLNPDLIQAQSAINRIADASPVLVVEDVPHGFTHTTNVSGLTLRDRITGEAIVTGEEILAWQENAVFSPDSRYLATAGDDHALHLWELATGELVHRMAGHLKPINQIIFTPDSRYVISASDDLSAVVWDVQTGQEVHRLTGHESPITALAASPDSSLVATGGDIPPIIMWDIASGEKLWQSPETGRNSLRLQFQQDGNVLFSWWNVNLGSYEYMLERWNPYTGALMSAVDKPIYRGFNDDGTIAWSGGYRILQAASSASYTPNRGSLRLWNVLVGAQRQELINGFDWRIDSVKFLDFSPDTLTLLVGIESYTEGFVQAPNGLVIDPVGGLIEARLVHLDLSNGTVINRFETSSIPDFITSAAFMEDGQTVLSTTRDNTLILWDVNTEAVKRVVGVSDQQMTYLGLSPDGRYALTKSPTDTVRVWDTSETGTVEISRYPLVGSVELAFSPDEQQIWVRGENDLLAIDRETGEQINSVYPGNIINSVNFSPAEPRALVSIAVHWVEDRELAEYEYRSDGSGTLTGDDPRIHNTGGQLVEINPETGEILRTYGSLENSVYFAFYNRTGTQALVDFELWNMDNWQSIQSLLPPPLRDVNINMASFNLSRNNLGSTDRVSSYANRPEVGSNTSPRKLVLDADVYDNVAAFLSYYVITEFAELGPETIVDDQGIAHIRVKLNPVIEAGIRVSVMSPNTGEEIQFFADFSSSPTSIALNPEGTMILVGLASPENSILLYDVASGELIRRFVGHTQGVNDVAFSPDGLTALSASDDGTLILWDVATGQSIRQYTGHNEGVRRLAFSQDGRSAISSDSTEIIEWRIETLEDILARVHESRDVRPLNCIQREQYNVRPFCDELAATPTLSPSPTIVPTSFLRAEVIASAANVRSGQSAESSIMTTLPAGTVVDILAITPEWYHIQLPDGGEGWIARELVRRQ